MKKNNPEVCRCDDPVIFYLSDGSEHCRNCKKPMDDISALNSLIKYLFGLTPKSPKNKNI
jgi:hypothetical protein